MDDLSGKLERWHPKQYETPSKDLERLDRLEDPGEIHSLPERTLSAQADMREFTTEYEAGFIPKAVDMPDAKEYKLVTFREGDLDNPKNWSLARKWVCTITVGWVCFAVAFASAVVTPGIYAIAAEMDVSVEVALLSIKLFVIGFGLGVTLVFSPMSELYGRRIVYLTTFGAATIFVIPCAVAKNIQTLLICRAIDGIAFSVPVAVVGGTLADLWKQEERGVPMAVFSAAPFLGPILGPLVGGFVVDTKGWRWLYWLLLIISGFLFLCMIVLVPETYAPTILQNRAEKLRQETGDNSYVTELDIDRRPLGETLKIFLGRPFLLLFTEPIVFLLSLYAAVVYGLLYMFFVSYPIVFGEGKGWNPGKTGLMFIPIIVGVLIGVATSPLINKHYLQMCKKHPGRPPPELRLIPMIISSILLPVGMFIFAWTSYPHLSFAGPCLAGLPIGLGFVYLYNSFNNYIVDTYQHVAASALAAKTLIRSLWGASTVLFTIQMYHKLGYQWASSLLGFIALACCFIPLFFYFKGPAIRRYSKYAYSEEIEKTVAR